MSEKIWKERKEEIKKGIAEATILILLIVGAMVLVYAILPLFPHTDRAAEILTMVRWEYIRDNVVYVFVGIAFTTFMFLFSRLIIQDQKLLLQQKKEAARELLKEVLEEEAVSK